MLIDSIPFSGSYAVMASGSGSNAKALISRGKELNNPPRLLIVNKEQSPLLQWGAKEGIETLLIPSQVKGIDDKFESHCLDLFEKNQIQWVFLAGFLKILSQKFLSFFRDNEFYRVVNIHPSLLPLYPGLNSYQKSFQAGDDYYGHTIHLVSPEVDEGPVIVQVEIPRHPKHDLEDYINRGKKFENQTYAQVLEMALVSQKIVLNQKIKLNISEGELNE